MHHQPEKYVQAGIDTQSALHSLEESAGFTMRGCPKERLLDFRQFISNCLMDLDDEKYAPELEANRFLSPDIDVALRVAKPILQFRKAEALCNELGIQAMPQIAELLQAGRSFIENLELPLTKKVSI